MSKATTDIGCFDSDYRFVVSGDFCRHNDDGQRYMVIDVTLRYVIVKRFSPGGGDDLVRYDRESFTKCFTLEDDI